MAKRILITLALLALSGCSQKTASNQEPEIVSMQTIDRNGFSETISSKDRLKTFSKVDFLSPQPYQKVLRVYPRNNHGQSHSRITSYHPNGHTWQYLEVVEGRAHGAYKEWHSNGRLKIEAIVIEGLADVNEAAQASWLFEGLSKVYNEDGSLAAEFSYQKGVLQGDSKYYYPNGQIAKLLPYDENEIHGAAQFFSHTGELLESIPYEKGVKNGNAHGKSSDGSWSYEEYYSQGKLLEASYSYLKWENLPRVEKGEGHQLCFADDYLDSVIEIHEGLPQGCIRQFTKNGFLESIYHIKDGLKEGEEVIFFQTKPLAPLVLPKEKKLSIYWHEDAIQGKVKSWYENGVLESEREMNKNKRHGLATAYYEDGSLMLMEEYDNDKLLKGSYYQKKDKKPVSRIEEGKGTATIHFSDGRFKQKIYYEGGQPKIDS
jgi:antitoxin component YwqK of YwqJK toxin-antitoxin module